MANLKIIQPATFSIKEAAADCWIYRRVFWTLIWRDLSIKFKGLFLGLLWVFIRPLSLSALIYFAFSRVAGLNDSNAPYFLVVFAAVIPWQFFSGVVTEGSSSIVDQSALIQKVYFPRWYLPAVPAGLAFIELLLMLFLFIVMAGIFGLSPSSKILFLPLAIASLIFFTLGSSFLLSSISVRLRDLRYLIPLSLQILFFLSPIGFRTEVVPESLKFWIYLNPLSFLFEFFRFCLLPNSVLFFENSLFWLSLGMTFVVASFGIFQFLKEEPFFSDRI